jgi:hypothetical protein
MTIPAIGDIVIFGRTASNPDGDNGRTYGVVLRHAA